MSSIRKLLLILFLTFSYHVSEGQQTPLNPISIWVFTPYLYNPAMVGSKDYVSIDLNAAFQGKSRSQIISGNTRFSMTRSGYFASPDIVEFKNFGFGGSVFNDINGPSRNIGLSAAGSYQIPLNTRKLSFLSFGASIKGVYNRIDTSTVEPGTPSKKTFYRNLDVGIYYFGTSFFTGFSTTNLFGNPENTDSLGILSIPVDRQYFFSAGYKILIDRSMNIVLEPSVLINAYDSTFNNISHSINPILKLYVENFCVGTYFFSNGKTSFFTQFRYPRFYVGAFFELPKKTAYFRGAPIVQFTVGLNIQLDKSRLSNHSHW
jgi:type IX secretion system PorP/SprF family membrane protein